MLLDDCEQVAEQHAVFGREPLGDLVQRCGRGRGRLVGADARVTTTVERRAVAVTEVL
jgi:hypothetical protein